MDNDYNVDVREVDQTIATSDVVVLRFIAVGKRLLLDFRESEIDGPLVKVVEPVKSVNERYAELARLRPRFQQPQSIVAVWWPRFVPSLRSTGVWDTVMRRVTECGHVDAVRRAEDALAELEGLERGQQRDAVRGEGFKTLWSRSPAKR